MNYFRQIYYEMKHQRMMTWVSISGTALAIFLVMAVIMADRINTVEVAPESNRGRILKCGGFNVNFEDGRSWSGMPYTFSFAKQLYEGIEGIDRISFKLSRGGQKGWVRLKGGATHNTTRLEVDNEFWNIYDFKFIDGRPYDAAEVASNAKLVVITQSLARSLFGEDKVSGREIYYGDIPYKVIGVVEDVNPLLSNTYAEVFKLYSPAFVRENDRYIGDSEVIMLMSPGVTAEEIKSRVKERFMKVQPQFAKEGMTLIYNEQPCTAAEQEFLPGDQPERDLASKKQRNLIMFAILLLLPAINLGSLTRGRLRHRVSEIGVRRAFGATRSSIVRQIFGENLVITLLGGLIGLVVSFLFMKYLFHLFFNFSGYFGPSSLAISHATPDFSMLFTWDNFLLALLFCFVLNTLSATVPAWRASGVEPAEAISFSH